MFTAATVTSDENFSLDLGRNLGKALRRKLGQLPNACWLFCAPKAGLQDLLDGINETVSTRNIVGCTTAGEMSCAGYHRGSAVLGGIASDQMGTGVRSGWSPIGLAKKVTRASGNVLYELNGEPAHT